MVATTTKTFETAYLGQCMQKVLEVRPIGLAQNRWNSGPDLQQYHIREARPDNTAYEC